MKFTPEDILVQGAMGLDVPASLREDLDNLVRATGASQDMAIHKLMGERIYGPINRIARYNETFHHFFMQESGAPNNVTRIVVDEYHMVAVDVTPDGQFLYQRPGFYYATITWEAVDAGLEIRWWDLEYAGWPILQKKMQEVADELARNRDTKRKTALDAAIAGISGHSSSVATTMTKASIDAILKSARQAGFDITLIVVNNGTIMDMSSWTVISGVSMWELDSAKARELFSNLYVSNYGGCYWLASKEVASTTVYLTSGPQNVGWEWHRAGDPRTYSDPDITQKVDRHAWEELIALRVDNPYALWKLTIT